MRKKQCARLGNALVMLIIIIWNIQTSKAQPNQKTKPSKTPQVTEWLLSTAEGKNDPQLYVREFGKGNDTIIMLHGGWGAEHRGLLNAVKELHREYRFIFYDQRGSLRSPCTDSLISFQNHINDLELLRKELNLEKVTLVGHSMGTVLGAAYAQKYPKRIRKLILLAPAYLKQPFPDEDQPLKHKIYLKSQKFQKREALHKELEKYNLNREDPPLSSKEKTMKFRINIAAMMLYDITKWTELYSGGPFFNSKVYQLTEKTYPKEGWNFYKEFAQTTYPISIIIGDHDWIDFQGLLTKQWMREVPRIKFTLIKNAGHDLWIDQKQELTKQLRIHLN